MKLTLLLLFMTYSNDFGFVFMKPFDGKHHRSALRRAIEVSVDVEHLMYRFPNVAREVTATNNLKHTDVSFRVNYTANEK